MMPYVQQKENQSLNKRMIKTLSGQGTDRPPFWFMRQAGRYLPEYRTIRQDTGSFLDLCYTPEKAAEVTIQPVERYGMDAAILFSDILVIPHALGQDVRFVEGEGPKLTPIRSVDDLQNLSSESFQAILDPIYNTIKIVNDKLNPETTFIGFAGAPWTVACYMIEGGGSRDFINVKTWAYNDPSGFDLLIERLVEATITYLSEQIDAGVNVVQIFDSWAGVLPEEGLQRWVIEPTKKIVDKLNNDYPDIPVIGFPRGAGVLYKDYAEQTNVTAVSLDTTVPVKWASETLQSICVVQGNLDPVFLLTGGQSMLDETSRILDGFSDKGFIFNLGHGIQKETPPEHVQMLCDFLKQGS